MQEICMCHVNISCQINHHDTFPIKAKIPKTTNSYCPLLVLSTGGEVVVFICQQRKLPTHFQSKKRYTKQ